MKKRLRIAIYGGTFDPVHVGHLLLARDVLEQQKLDAVLFVPCGQSPLKKRKPLAPDAQRLSMLRRALKGEPRFWVSRCEMDRPGLSYSIDTALEIREAFPHAELFWILGDDQWTTLDQWRRPDELRRLVKFILLRRGSSPPPAETAPVLSLPRPRRIDISATEIRHRVKARLPIDHLVPAPVAAYIQRHGLYGS